MDERMTTNGSPWRGKLRVLSAPPHEDGLDLGQWIQSMATGASALGNEVGNGALQERLTADRAVDLLGELLLDLETLATAAAIGMAGSAPMLEEESFDVRGHDALRDMVTLLALARTNSTGETIDFAVEGIAGRLDRELARLEEQERSTREGA